MLSVYTNVVRLSGFKFGIKVLMQRTRLESAVKC